MNLSEVIQDFPVDTLRDFVELDTWETQPEPVIRVVCTRLTRDLPLARFLQSVTLEKWIPPEG